MKKYISPNSEIVSSPHFESAIVKIQNEKEGKLSILEKNAVKSLLLDPESIPEPEPSEKYNSFASSILAEAGSRYKPKSKYLDLRFIPPGSCAVESLFSVAGHLFNDRRLNITPVHMEEQIFLKINRSFWSFETLIQVSSTNDL
jgi:hypothetical protein